MKYLWVLLKGPPITLVINFYCSGNRPLAVLAASAIVRRTSELSNFFIISFLKTMESGTENKYLNWFNYFEFKEIFGQFNAE